MKKSFKINYSLNDILLESIKKIQIFFIFI